MKYEISSKTLVDIIDKVPLDRIEVIMAELTSLLIQARSSVGICRSLDSNATFELPDILTWEDDGKGEVGVRHTIKYKNDSCEFTTMDKVDP